MTNTDTECVPLGYYRTKGGHLVKVVYVMTEDEAKIKSGPNEHRLSYRIVGYFTETKSAETWKMQPVEQRKKGSKVLYPWIAFDTPNQWDLVEFLGPTL